MIASRKVLVGKNLKDVIKTEGFIRYLDLEAECLIGHYKKTHPVNWDEIVEIRAAWGALIELEYCAAYQHFPKEGVQAALEKCQELIRILLRIIYDEE